MLYNYGGVYSDMDSVCIKPLNGLFNYFPEHEVFITSLEPNGNLNNSNFACIKNSLFLKLTIEAIIKDYNNHLKGQYYAPYLPVNTTFSDVLLQNPQKVNFTMRDFVMHCYTLKTTSWLLDQKHVSVNFNNNNLSFNDFFILYKNFLDKIEWKYIILVDGLEK